MEGLLWAVVCPGAKEFSAGLALPLHRVREPPIGTSENHRVIQVLFLTI